MSRQIDEKALHSKLRHFIQKYKFKERGAIPKNHISDLVNLLNESAHVVVTFEEENPLSVMETITITLCILNSTDHEIGLILGVSRNTVKSYMSRIKDKLEATKRLEAVVKTIRSGIIRMSY